MDKRGKTSIEMPGWQNVRQTLRLTLSFGRPSRTSRQPRLPSRHWRRLMSSSCLSMPLARSGWQRTVPQESSLSFFRDVSRVKACMGCRHADACMHV